MCGKEFSSLASLESHRKLHKQSSSLGFKCDKCNSAFSSSGALNSHKSTAHSGRTGSELAIPIVNLALPNTQMMLARAGITSFIPLSQLQTGRAMQFALPILNVETSGKVTRTSLEGLGATNVLMLGKLRSLQKK